MQPPVLIQAKTGWRHGCQFWAGFRPGSAGKFSVPPTSYRFNSVNFGGYLSFMYTSKHLVHWCSARFSLHLLCCCISLPKFAVNSANSVKWATFGLVFGGSWVGIFTQTWQPWLTRVAVVAMWWWSPQMQYTSQHKVLHRAQTADTVKPIKKVAHTRLPSVGFRSWSRFLAVSMQVTES